MANVFMQKTQFVGEQGSIARKKEEKARLADEDLNSDQDVQSEAEGSLKSSEQSVHNFLEYVESDDDFFDKAGKVTKLADEAPMTYESLKKQMQLLIT